VTAASVTAPPTHTHSPSEEFIYETLKREWVRDDDFDDDFLEE